MTFRRALFSALLVLVLAPGSAAAQNVLSNRSFENGLATWSGTNASLAVLSGGPFGSKHARATRTSGSSFGLSSRQRAGFPTNQRIKARASVRAPKGKRICVRIQERRSAKVVARSSRCVRATGGWQRPAATRHKIRSSANRVVVSILTSRSGGANRLDVDKVYLGKKSPPKAGTVIRTAQPWNCSGALRSFGRLPIKVVSRIPHPGSDNAINLRGCYGDGDPKTIDLILDVRGNGGSLGTGYDAVRVGQDARDLVVTGHVECGGGHGGVHQDIVQALSGKRIRFVDFSSGNTHTGRWTCWGAGGGWYVTWANGDVPTGLVCIRCQLATYNQNLRIDESVRSGARHSIFGYSRSYGIFIGPQAQDPVNVKNRVIRY
jgi:hypothetical protein